MGDQRLRPSERLRHQREYQRVFQCGTKRVSSAFVVYVLPTAEPHSRLGFAVSKRIGNAVTRNRVKRRARAFFRLQKAQLRSPYDIVVVARRGAAKASYAECARQLSMLLRCCWQPQELGQESGSLSTNGPLSAPSEPPPAVRQ